MPNFDGTGPQGKGAENGLGRGNCNSDNSSANIKSGRLFRRKGFFGRGSGNNCQRNRRKGCFRTNSDRTAGKKFFGFCRRLGWCK